MAAAIGGGRQRYRRGHCNRPPVIVFDRCRQRGALAQALVGALGDLVAELFAALQADVRHDPGVDAAVDEVGDPLTEAFAASLADKGSLAAMDPLVVLQRGQFLKGYIPLNLCIILAYVVRAELGTCSFVQVRSPLNRSFYCHGSQ